MNQARNLYIAQLVGNPCQMFGLLWVGSKHGSTTLVLTGCVSDATFKADTDRPKATCLHALTEGLSDAPTVIGNDHGAARLNWCRNTWTRFNFNLPAPSAFVMTGRLGGCANVCWLNLDGRGGLGRRPSALHLDDVRREVVQRGMVSQHEILVDGKSEAVSDLSHDFRLLHRIDAQFAFEVLVHLNEIGRISGVVNHHRDQDPLDVRMGSRRGRCR